jgi:outer membrane immunogenic protein
MIARLLAASALLGALSATALAADLGPPPTYAPPPVPIFTWAGFYIGGQIGYQWGASQNVELYEPAGVFLLYLPGHDDNGVVGGAHIGYNWQISQFVFGLEGDVNGSSYQGSSIFENAITDFTKIGIEGSIRGRVGIAWDHLLIYGTGGVAFASINHTFNLLILPGAEASSSRGRAGWTVGGGIEYAVTNNWSIRTEYRYTDYGTVSYPSEVEPGLDISKCITDNIVTVGFSYKFDWAPPLGPVVAKY